MERERRNGGQSEETRRRYADSILARRAQAAGVAPEVLARRDLIEKNLRQFYAVYGYGLFALVPCTPASWLIFAYSARDEATGYVLASGLALSPASWVVGRSVSYSLLRKGASGAAVMWSMALALPVPFMIVPCLAAWVWLAVDARRRRK